MNTNMFKLAQVVMNKKHAVKLRSAMHDADNLNIGYHFRISINNAIDHGTFSIDALIERIIADKV